MEFFRIINVKTTEEELQKRLTPENLEHFTTLLFGLDKSSDGEIFIGGIWGEFTLTRQEIKGGVRFALKECPNALCWTVTTGYPPQRDAVVVHLTINRTRKKPEFLDEIEEFLADHSRCIETMFNAPRLN